MGVTVPQAIHGGHPRGVSGRRLAPVVPLDHPLVDQQVAGSRVARGDVQPGGAPDPQRAGGGAHDPFPTVPLPAPSP
ncbi:MAG: hypothetical protein J4F99_05295, partial [Acidimicrobiia bacterium]|nr:hypothetical protein [Acidimicrobiia bacterium]